MKKVLIAMTSLYNGGAERSLVNLLNEFPADKYEIDLVLFKKSGMFLKQVPENINVIDTPISLKRMYGSLSQAGILLPWKILANIISKLVTHNSREKRGFRWKYFYGPVIRKLDKHYDVALAYISGEILYYIDEKVDADRKIVWIHNDYRSAGHPRKYDYKHLKNMDALVSISDSCVDILKDEFPEFAHKTYMLENITSSVVLQKRASEFYPKEFDKNSVNILSIGRLHEQKGFDMAIKAAAIMKSKGLDFKWFVIGSGELESDLKNKIKSENLEDNFILLGARENPYPYTKNCSLFVQPSRYEGKSVVLDEAKILGVPIMATAYPTVADQLENGKEGKVVNMDAESIAIGIMEMIQNDEERESYCSYLNSREYGNQQEIEKYCDLIDAD